MGRKDLRESGMAVEDRESSGISPAECVEQDRPEGGPVRPLSMAWIPDEFLAKTKRVWSKAYGREVDDAEAVEILMNVKRTAEVLLRIKRERLKS